jgi:hypothetical protein
VASDLGNCLLLASVSLKPPPTFVFAFNILERTTLPSRH